MSNLPILLLFFLFSVVSSASGYCPTTKCHNDKFSVRFPFQLKNVQPQNCGYPDFNLTCNDQGKTVLNLPSSGDFLVRNINYYTRQIQLCDPDNCIANRLLNFNLSGSPFVAPAYQNYTFLSCPTQLVESRFATIGCLSNSTISILATTSTGLSDSLSRKSCKVMKVLSIPVPWPVKNDEGLTSELKKDIQLTWYSPDCGDCEPQGGICGFKTNNSQEIGCFVRRTGPPNGVLQTLRVICLSIAIPSMLLAGGIVAVAFIMDRRPQRNRRGPNQTIDPAAVTPQPNTGIAGLDESTIELYEKVVLGESMRLPAGPNGNMCAICLAEYCINETLRFIPECNHCFHAECIDEWLKLNGSCPVCRKSPAPSPVHDVLQNV